MKIKLFENFNGRLIYQDYKTNIALEEIPNLEDYLQDILDLGYTEIIIKCTSSVKWAATKFTSVSWPSPTNKDHLGLYIKIIYGNSENNLVEKDFENLAEIMTTSIEAKDRIIGDGWVFGGFRTEGDAFFTKKYLELYFEKKK